MKNTCPYCFSINETKSAARKTVRAGVYKRQSDGKIVQRFHCLRCDLGFSSATLNLTYGQKKRQLNHQIANLFAVGVSLRDIGRTLKISRSTVARKLQFMGQRKREELNQWNTKYKPASNVQFDDLETFEHTKCKPVSVTLIVEERTRRIIDFEVSRMPAKGNLAQISVKKYGRRRDERPAARKKLFKRVKKFVDRSATIRSDSNPHYAPDVKRHFPKATHITVIGGRGSSTGQGELKKLKFDPLFSLNHTCAMLRAHINRLFRRTWCTTKRIERLRDHIYIYAMAHNRRLYAG